jgi:hypothetical protein
MFTDFAGDGRKAGQHNFIVSGHYDSMPSFKEIMDPTRDAPARMMMLRERQ